MLTKENGIDKCVPEGNPMVAEPESINVAIVAFGPVAERLGGRSHRDEMPRGSTIHDLVMKLGLEEWISFGLSVALNGERCSIDTTLSEDDEVALLPPVSGG